MRNSYKELIDKQMAETNSFPVKAANNNEQFEKIVNEWNLSFDENSDNYYGKQLIPLGLGMFIRKKDVKAFNDMLNRHREEHLKAIKEDKTGEGYIYDMFVYELQKHKYKYTYRVDEVLQTLNVSIETLLQNTVMSQALIKARKYVESLDD